MSTFEIGKHSTRRSGHPIALTECRQAFASFDAANGFRVIGFDSAGRRYSVTINDALMQQLCAQYASVAERRWLRETA
jgi:hypothetical protein